MRSLLLVGLLVQFISYGQAARAQTVNFDFYVPGTTKALARGTETFRKDGKDVVKHTEYAQLDGTVVQVEDVRFDEASLRLQSYRFEDRASGEFTTVEVKGDEAKATYGAAKGEAPDTATFAWTASSHTGKTLGELIERNFSKLERGEHIDFDLYVPFRLEMIGFRALKSPNQLKPEGVKAPYTIRAEPTNFVIRMLAPSIDFVFDTSGNKPQLVRYFGPAMIELGGEKNRKVEMHFR